MTTQSTGRLAGRFLKAFLIGRGDPMARDAFLERTAWTDAHIVKGAIGAATSGSASAFLNQVGRDFIEFVRPQTIVGRLLYPRVIPWNTRTAYQTNGPAAAWTGEGTAIPALGPTYSKEDPMPVRKVAGVAVTTLELAQATDAPEVLTRDLAKACVELLDRTFIDPDETGDSVTPASVTNGATSIPASTLPAGDLSDAVEALVSGGGDLMTSQWIMHPMMYAHLILTRVVSENGLLAGRPVIASSAVPSSSTNGSPIALVDSEGIELSGGTDAELMVSTHGDVNMTDTPGSESYTVSMFQSESAAMRAVVPINWRATRTGCVVYIDGASY